MKGEPGCRPRACLGVSLTGVSEAGCSAGVVAVVEGLSVVEAEMFWEGWEPELLCVMGPPGTGTPDFVQYSPIEGL